MAPGLVGQTIEQIKGMPMMQTTSHAESQDLAAKPVDNPSSLQRRSTRYHEANTHSA
jgi:hypothetical protein